jgi:PAS domain S-box-containing protein
MENRFLYPIALFLNIFFLIINLWQGQFLSWPTYAFAANIFILLVLKGTDTRQWKEINLLIGKGQNASTIKKHLMEARSFMEQVQTALLNINEIGQTEFVDVMKSVDDSSIREPLLLANEKIIGLRKNESETNWIAQGVAAVADLKQKENNISEYSFQVISTIVKYLNANQGGFFLLKEEGDESYFELAAAYAYGRKKHLEKRIKPGEGLVGQVYYEKEIIYLTDVPKDYVKITSGLGEALPRCVSVVPLMSDGKIYGAIEIASFNQLQASEMEYLKKISENIGYTLSSIENHRRTEAFLEESQEMAREVKSQEMELRQNMEELTATQEQMRRKQDEMNSLLSSLSVIELDLEGKILDANKIFTGSTGYNLNDITGKHYNHLTQNDDPAQFNIMWGSILSGKVFSGEFKIVNRDKKEIWMAGNFTPILNENLQPFKVTVITVFTTRDKEKMTELQEMVTAFRSCFPVAEINEDMSFKSANDLFLTELGIRRLDLKKSSPQSVFQESSLSKLEKYLHDIEDQPNNTILDIVQKNGSTKGFNSTLLKLNHHGSNRKRSLVILRNTL